LGNIDSPRYPVAFSLRLVLIGLWMLQSARLLQAQLSAAEAAEAVEFARRAAMAVSTGSPRVFAEALDIEGTLQRGLGAAAWSGLTPRQRDLLRTVVRDQFVDTLAGPRSSGSEIAWSWVEPSASAVNVSLGLRFAEKTLKTRWLVSHVGAGWKITDIVLADPGISLAAAAIRDLGPEPVRRRQPVREAEQVAYPRLIGLAAIGLIVLLFAPRLPAPKRSLLLLTMAAPAILFTIDGVLAVKRTLAERYALRDPGARTIWRESEGLALVAEKEGRVSEAGRQWARALANGAPPGPIEYEMGLAARRRGDRERARQDFTKAIEEREPAPGAARELASLDAEAGHYEEAERNLARCLVLSGPDPELLSLAAVLQTNLGKTSDSLHSLQQARALLGDAWRAAELEAKVRARAGDAAGAVAVLRSLDAQGLTNRAELRTNPSYLTIANDPVWVAFINERAPPPPEKRR
jgi:hypothetical protein